MSTLQNILVGVDLAQCKSLQMDGLSPIVRGTVAQAQQIARANQARLLFLAATNIKSDSFVLLDDASRNQMNETIHSGGNQLLQQLVLQAQSLGIEARSKLVSGTGWEEIIRQVLLENHDLVLVGTRDLSWSHRMFFGSTAMKLLRYCPCPVLVVKPLQQPSHHSILVVTDFKPTSLAALHLAILFARQEKAHLYVLHVVEYHLDEVCNIGLPDSMQNDYRNRVRAHAENTLQQQLDQTDFRSLGTAGEIHIRGDVGRPDVAIRDFIQTHKIDMLVMGTIDKIGFSGITFGNTAERLLPEITCSLLAIKPSDFPSSLSI